MTDPYKALKGYDQWILYAKTPHPLTTHNGESFVVPAKSPLNPHTMFPADPTDTRYHLPYASAVLFESDNIGVGFVFTKDDPFFFLDIDTEKALYKDKDFGGWTPETNAIVARFPGAAVELSMSGRGLHVIGSGVCPPHGCKHEHKDFFTESRYVALTYSMARGDAATDHTPALEAMVAEYFQPGATASENGVDGWTNEPRADWCGPLDNADLLEVFLNCKPSATQTFGVGATNRQLWENDEEALIAAFPADGASGKVYNGSSADMALAVRLMWLTGCDCERVSQLMWESSLVRDKWEERSGYVNDTIMGAFGRHGTDAVYNNPRYAIREAGDGSFRDFARGAFIFGPDEYKRYFDGMVYVASLAKIYTGDEEVPIAGQQVFNDLFSNACTFQLDYENAKPTKKAWDAFCNSAMFEPPKVRSTCFSPLHAYGDIVETGRDRDGNPLRDVNICAMPKVVGTPGDPAPFLGLVERMFADQVDRDILISYFAACVQYPGQKFNWAPVIQGEEGNGKSLLLKFLKHALGGKYVHTLASHELTNGFNAWLGRSILVLAEDLHIEPMKRRATMEILKEMITAHDQSITNKGVDSESRRVFANFVFTTNFKDTIQKSEGARRYCMLFTQQQEFEDIARTGLTTDFFNALVDWADGGGFDNITHYLQTYEIPYELDPTKGAKRAPDTSTTHEAISHGLSFAEQIVLEATEHGEEGFRGGFISTKALTALYKDNGIKQAPRSVSKTLKAIGYIPHPALEGKVIYTGLALDGANTRLYCRKGSPCIMMPRETLKAEYVRAQAPTGDTSPGA